MTDPTKDLTPAEQHEAAVQRATDMLEEIISPMSSRPSRREMEHHMRQAVTAVQEKRRNDRR